MACPRLGLGAAPTPPLPANMPSRVAGPAPGAPRIAGQLTPDVYSIAVIDQRLAEVVSAIDAAGP